MINRFQNWFQSRKTSDLQISAQPCLQPVTTNEFNRSGAKFLLYSKGVIFNATKLIFIDHYENGWVDCRYIRLTHFTLDSIYQFENSSITLNYDHLLQSARKDNTLIDSLTYFRILSNRTDCDDPLNETKRVFNRIVRQYNTNRVKDLLLLLEYIIGHLWLFKIKYIPPSFQINEQSLSRSDQKLLHHINSLINVTSPIINDIIDSFRFNSNEQIVYYSNQTVLSLRQAVEELTLL